MKANEVERFWSKVDRRSDGECWLWLGSDWNSMGYGRFCTYAGNRRFRHLAHRYAFEAFHGEIDPNLVLLHSCDTPACVNPHHLNQGTQRENLLDAHTKGRIDLTGLTALTEIECKTCGSTFKGGPSRRYCDEHRKRSQKSTSVPIDLIAAMQEVAA